MILYMKKKRSSLSHKILSGFIALTFLMTVVVPPQGVAQMVPVTVVNLPPPGMMVNISPGYTPTLIKGLTIHPENPLQFDFIVDTGDSELQGLALRRESTKLVKYFLASLTVPEQDMWVNLSPYEKDRIIPESFGVTEMGRDLLAQDYILKQLTASLMYPENELGKKFWDRVYEKAQALYGITDIPMNTFNKVWIVPKKAVVYEHEGSAFVVESHLKVMLEEDYEVMQKKPLGTGEEHQTTESKQLTEVIREVLIPEIEKEVNEGRNFANLRQIYNAMILAAWYKNNLKESLLGQVYVNKNKTKGVDVDDPQVKQKIYNQYLEAFKTGVYNYIKEDYDPNQKEVIPRKYFSGGFLTGELGNEVSGSKIKGDIATVGEYDRMRVTRSLKPNGEDAMVFMERVNLYEVGAEANSTELAKTQSGEPLVVATDDESMDFNIDFGDFGNRFRFYSLTSEKVAKGTSLFRLKTPKSERGVVIGLMDTGILAGYVRDTIYAATENDMKDFKSHVKSMSEARQFLTDEEAISLIHKERQTDRGLLKRAISHMILLWRWDQKLWKEFQKKVQYPDYQLNPSDSERLSKMGLTESEDRVISWNQLLMEMTGWYDFSYEVFQKFDGFIDRDARVEEIIIEIKKLTSKAIDVDAYLRAYSPERLKYIFRHGFVDRSRILAQSLSYFQEGKPFKMVVDFRIGTIQFKKATKQDLVSAPTSQPDDESMERSEGGGFIDISTSHFISAILSSVVMIGLPIMVILATDVEEPDPWEIINLRRALNKDGDFSEQDSRAVDIARDIRYGTEKERTQALLEASRMSTDFSSEFEYVLVRAAIEALTGTNVSPERKKNATILLKELFGGVLGPARNLIPSDDESMDIDVSFEYYKYRHDPTGYFENHRLTGIKFGDGKTLFRLNVPRRTGKNIVGIMNSIALADYAQSLMRTSRVDETINFAKIVDEIRGESEFLTEEEVIAVLRKELKIDLDELELYVSRIKSLWRWDKKLWVKFQEKIEDPAYGFDKQDAERLLRMRFIDSDGQVISWIRYFMEATGWCLLVNVDFFEIDGFIEKGVEFKEYVVEAKNISNPKEMENEIATWPIFSDGDKNHWNRGIVDRSVFIEKAIPFFLEGKPFKVRVHFMSGVVIFEEISQKVALKDETTQSDDESMDINIPFEDYDVSFEGYRLRGVRLSAGKTVFTLERPDPQGNTIGVMNSRQLNYYAGELMAAAEERSKPLFTRIIKELISSITFLSTRQAISILQKEKDLSDGILRLTVSRMQGLWRWDKDLWKKFQMKIKYSNYMLDSDSIQRLSKMGFVKPGGQVNDWARLLMEVTGWYAFSDKELKKIDGFVDKKGKKSELIIDVGESYNPHERMRHFLEKVHPLRSLFQDGFVAQYELANRVRPFLDRRKPFKMVTDFKAGTIAFETIEEKASAASQPEDESMGIDINFSDFKKKDRYRTQDIKFPAYLLKGERLKDGETYFRLTRPEGKGPEGQRGDIIGVMNSIVLARYASELMKAAADLDEVAFEDIIKKMDDDIISKSHEQAVYILNRERNMSSELLWISIRKMQKLWRWDRQLWKEFQEKIKDPDYLLQKDDSTRLITIGLIESEDHVFPWNRILMEIMRWHLPADTSPPSGGGFIGEYSDFEKFISTHGIMTNHWDMITHIKRLSPGTIASLLYQGYLSKETILQKVAEPLSAGLPFKVVIDKADGSINVTILDQEEVEAALEDESMGIDINFEDFGETFKDYALKGERLEKGKTLFHLKRPKADGGDMIAVMDSATLSSLAGRLMRKAEIGDLEGFTRIIRITFAKNLFYLTAESAVETLSEERDISHGLLEHYVQKMRDLWRWDKNLWKEFQNRIINPSHEFKKSDEERLSRIGLADSGGHVISWNRLFVEVTGWYQLGDDVLATIEGFVDKEAREETILIDVGKVDTPHYIDTYFRAYSSPILEAFFRQGFIDRNEVYERVAPFFQRGKPFKMIVDMKNGTITFESVEEAPAAESSEEAMAADQAYIKKLNKERPVDYPKRRLKNPETFTDKTVLQNVKSKKNPEGWAHPDVDDPKLSPAERTELIEQIRAEIKRFAPETKFGKDGLPIYGGETGLEGRGLLGRYGPNPAEDAVLLRYNKEGEIEVLVIDRDDGRGMALPGLMTQFGDENKIGVTATQAALKKANVDVDFSKGMVVFHDTVDDWRDTNRNKVKSRGVARILSYEESQELILKAKKGAKPGSARFVSVNANNNFYARHSTIVASAVAKVQTGQLKTDEERAIEKHPPLTLSMTQLEKAYEAFRAGKENIRAAYDLIAPRTPHGGNLLVFAGLEETLADMRRRRFTEEHIEEIEKLGIFSKDFLKYLRKFIFEGDVEALQEGRIVSAGIPLMRIYASEVELALLEDLVKNRIGTSSNIATKTARISLAAKGEFLTEKQVERLIKKERLTPDQIFKERKIMEDGQNYAQGKSSLLASYAAVVGGAEGTSNIKAAKRFNLKAMGSMSRLFINTFSPDKELLAFYRYVNLFPDWTAIPIDTYDPIQGARNAIEIARQLADENKKLIGVSLHRGNFAKVSKKVRKMLDEAGFPDIKIFVSADLNEKEITQLIAKGARIDGFGISASVATGGEQTSLELEFQPSDEKRVWIVESGGKIRRYVKTLKESVASAKRNENIEELLVPYWKDGKRVFGIEKTWQAHKRAASEMERLGPERMKFKTKKKIPVSLQKHNLTINPETDGLVVIDMQKTFMPGGGLAVAEGDQIVPNVRDLMDLFPKKNRFASLDRHMPGHISLASSYIGLPAMTTVLTSEMVASWTEEDNPMAPHAKFTLDELKDYLKDRPQVLWPDHGIEGDQEAQIHPSALMKEFAEVIIKGMDPSTDSYSAFFDNRGRPTGLADMIRKRGLKRLFFVGLAGDYCVGWSAEGAVEEGFEALVFEDATRHVGFPEDSIKNMHKSYMKKGIKLIPETQSVIDANNYLGVRPATTLSTSYGHPIIHEEEERTALEEKVEILTLAETLFWEGTDTRQVTFDYSVPTPPYGEDKIIVSGVKFLIEAIKNFRFTKEDIAYLRERNQFSEAFLTKLLEFKFKGDIEGLPDGSVAYANEPILRVQGTALEVMIIKSLVLKIMNYNSLIATYANKIRREKGEDVRLILDGLAGAQGGSHLEAAYSAFIGGINATTDLDAHMNFGIPLADSTDTTGVRLDADFITGGPESRLDGQFTLARIGAEDRISISETGEAISFPDDKDIVDIEDEKGRVVRRLTAIDGEEFEVTKGQRPISQTMTLVKGGKFEPQEDNIYVLQDYRAKQAQRYQKIEKSDLTDELVLSIEEAANRFGNRMAVGDEAMVIFDDGEFKRTGQPIVIIVEDDYHRLELLYRQEVKSFLSKNAGVEFQFIAVKDYSSARAAIDIATGIETGDENLLRLVITDGQYPIGPNRAFNYEIESGSELLRFMRKNLPDVPVVMASGYPLSKLLTLPDGKRMDERPDRFIDVGWIDRGTIVGVFEEFLLREAEGEEAMGAVEFIISEDGEFERKGMPIMIVVEDDNIVIENLYLDEIRFFAEENEGINIQCVIVKDYLSARRAIDIATGKNTDGDDLLQVVFTDGQFPKVGWEKSGTFSAEEGKLLDFAAESGAELVRFLKSSLPHVPVVMITGSDEHELFFPQDSEPIAERPDELIQKMYVADRIEDLLKRFLTPQSEEVKVADRIVITQDGTFAPNGEPIVVIAEDEPAFVGIYHDYAEMFLEKHTEARFQFVIAKDYSAARKAIDIARGITVEQGDLLHTIITDARYPSGMDYDLDTESGVAMVVFAKNELKVPVIMMTSLIDDRMYKTDSGELITERPDETYDKGLIIFIEVFERHLATQVQQVAERPEGRLGDVADTALENLEKVNFKGREEDLLADILDLLNTMRDPDSALGDELLTITQPNTPSGDFAVKLHEIFKKYFENDGPQVEELLKNSFGPFLMELFGYYVRPRAFITWDHSAINKLTDEISAYFEQSFRERFMKTKDDREIIEEEAMDRISREDKTRLRDAWLRSLAEPENRFTIADLQKALDDFGNNTPNLELLPTILSQIWCSSEFIDVLVDIVRNYAMTPDRRLHRENFQLVKKFVQLLYQTDVASVIAEAEKLVKEYDDDGMAIQADRVGGINLNPQLLDLQIKRDGKGIPLPVHQQPILEMNIEGFVPVIIEVIPVTNLPLFLGIADEERPYDSAEGEPTLELSRVSVFEPKDRFVIAVVTEEHDT